ncbi:hypothetical protein R5R35_004580 [Gryllus longicercus]|uniref:HAT C-terminal dimerisation domain-containing protein n=1 Tax=Gryllus longicercus TaxID=2509291 RepID=A0AAN9V7K4_9ORTH
MPKDSKKKKYSQKYKKEWEAEKAFKEWLTSVPGQNSLAFCKCCKSELKAHKKDLESHANTQKHLKKMAELGSVAQTPQITQFVRQTIDDRRKIAELKVAAFIAEHCSVATVDHLGELIKSLDGKSETLKELKLHRTKCMSLIVNVISPCLLQDLMDDVGDSYYSLIIDDTTTIDTKKVMGIMIRYCSKKKRKVVTTFYRLVELEAGDAQTIYDAFKQVLEEDGLKLHKLIGIGVDGASVMVGSRNSFATRLTKDIPNAVIVKCLCHSLHLAAEHAFKVLPSNLEFMIRETHGWFSNSTKRQVAYKEIYNLIAGGVPKKTVKLSGTRWLERIDAIQTILNQWDALELHFGLADEKDRCYTARQLHSMYKDTLNKMYLTYVCYIFKKVTSVNKLFQSDQVDPLKLFEDLHELMFFLMQQIVVPQQLARLRRSAIHAFEFKSFLMPSSCVNFGYDFNALSVNKNPDIIHDVKERCVKFVVSLCDEIQKRLPNNLEILESVKKFSPDSTKKFIKADINNIVLQFSLICDIDETIAEWNLLSNIDQLRSDSTEQLWLEISEIQNSCGNSRFKHISDFVFALLSIPFSNAAVERCFSVLNVIKDKLRNRMAITTADCILRVRYGMAGGCQQFAPSPSMLKKFNTENMYESKIDESIVDAMAYINM